ncbi:GOLPH3/VPS74 family protein [Williamsia sp. MIQD14]|uniref:GOLPH3/VPS74 family protein n=1 Tax=Williamsia sp. MIQD14 TaxID=3425703 RepID=UPI003DA09BD8
MSTRTVVTDLIWLSFDPRTGVALAPDGVLDVAVAGALVADLALRERIDLVDGSITVTDASPVGTTVLDDALHAIAAAGSTTPPQVITRLTSTAGRVRADEVAAAVTAGVLEHRTRKRLRLFTTHQWLPVPGQAAAEVAREVEAAISTPGATLRPHVATVIAVLDATRMAHRRFPSADPGQIATATTGSWADAALRAATRQIQVAITAAITVATTAAVTS